MWIFLFICIYDINVDIPVYIYLGYKCGYPCIHNYLGYKCGYPCRIPRNGEASLLSLAL